METTHNLVRRGQGNALHIAHPIVNSLCAANVNGFGPMASARPAGVGTPTCKSCRRIAGI